MQRSLIHRFALLALVMAAVHACRPLVRARVVDVMPSASTPADSPLVALISLVGRAEPALGSLWPGFWSADRGFVLMHPNGRALAISRSQPSGAFGPVVWNGMPEVYAGRVWRPADGAQFEPSLLDLAFPLGRDTVVLVTIDSSLAGSTVFLFHEAFHRFQREVFTRDSDVSEIIAAADLPGESFIESAMREQCLLAAALATTDSDDLRALLRRYADLRAKRLATVPAHIAAVERQIERYEGSATLIGYRAAATIFGDRAIVVRDSIQAFLASDSFELPSWLSPDWKLIRWRAYGTGAAQGLLLDQMGVDWKPRLTQGAFFDDILAGALASLPEDTGVGSVGPCPSRHQ